MYVIVKNSNNIIQGAFDKMKKLNREDIIRKHWTVLCKKQPGAKVFPPVPYGLLHERKEFAGYSHQSNPPPSPVKRTQSTNTL